MRPSSETGSVPRGRGGGRILDGSGHSPVHGDSGGQGPDGDRLEDWTVGGRREGGDRIGLCALEAREREAKVFNNGQ